MSVTDRMNRRVAMLHAYLIFHAKKMPVRLRERTCWLYLLTWASLGGTPDEVIR